tara:strand:+ start:1190 stop:1630 length:441 start_codon:yes stop_codon:yes gene_type:complete
MLRKILFFIIINFCNSIPLNIEKNTKINNYLRYHNHNHNPIIYHLILNKNFHYIGMTTNLNKKWHEHLNKKANLWTRIHKPIKIYNIYETNINDCYNDINCKKENDITYKLMNLYGLNKVRGGTCNCLNLNDNYCNKCKYFNKYEF